MDLAIAKFSSLGDWVRKLLEEEDRDSVNRRSAIL